VSKEVRDKSGTVELILISEPDREPTTESSFDEGPEAVSEEEVEAEAPCIECLTSPFTAPFGADEVRDSERGCGGDWNANACAGEAAVPRKDVLVAPLYMLRGVCPSLGDC